MWSINFPACNTCHITCHFSPACPRKPSVVIGRCNPRSCRQKVTVLIKRRSGCSCVVRRRKSSRVCCCRPKRIVERRCIGHKVLVRVAIRRTLRDGRCVAAKENSVRRRIVCKKFVKRSACNRRSRKRIVRIYTFRPKNCKCQRRPVKIRRELCRKSPRIPSLTNFR